MSDSSAPASTGSEAVSSAPEAGNNIEAAGGNAQGAKTQAKAAAPQATEAPKRYVVKVDGKETEVDEKELIKSYQLAKTSYQRMAEANKAKQEAEGLLKQVEEDPLKFLQHRNKNVREAAEKFLYEELKKEQMSPEQRKLAEYEQKLAAIEKEKEEARTQEESKKFQEEQQRYAQELDKQLTDALNKANLPKKAHTISRIAYIMESALSNGIDLSVDEAIDYYNNIYSNDIKEYISTLKGDSLLSFLGKDILNEIRRADVGRIKNPIQKEARKAEGKAPQNGKRKMTFDEMLNQLKGDNN